MCAFTATLQPNAGTVLDGAVLKLDTIVTTDLEGFRRSVVGCNLPPVQLTGAAVRGGRQKPGSISQHVNMGVAPVTRRGNDKVYVEDLVGRQTVDVRNDERKSATGTGAVGLHAFHKATTHDAVRPLRLVRAQLAFLVVHALVELLDQLQAHDAVVCASGFGEEVLSVPGWLGVELVNV